MEYADDRALLSHSFNYIQEKLSARMQLSFVPGRLKINEDDWNHESEDSTETVISAHGSLNIVKEFT